MMHELPIGQQIGFLAMLVYATAVQAVLFAGIAQAARAKSNLPTREQLVQVHRHLESLVLSCQAQIDVEVVPSFEDNLPLIKEVIRLKHVDATPEKYRGYLTNPAAVRAQSYTALWFRDGAKERFEFYPFRKVEPGEARMIMVFDGGTVRKFVPKRDAPRGTVASPEQAHWNQGLYPNPFSLIFHYYGRTVSEVLEQASQYEITASEGEGMIFRIRVVDPLVPNNGLEIRYDAEWRPLRRDQIAKFDDCDREPRVYERYDYLEWDTAILESGEPLDFPKRIVESAVVGIADNGVPATWKQQIIELSDVRFNVELSDDLFLLSFPESAVIDDQLQGFGLPADDPGVAAIVEQPQRNIPWVLIGNIAVVVLLLAAVAWQRRRRTG